MRKRLALAAALSLLGACRAVSPVSDEVTLDFADDSATVAITAQTKFGDDRENDVVRRRIDAAREAAYAGTDAWSVRFARVSPENERDTFQKTNGALESVTRQIRVPAADLQQVFADTNITVDLLQGDGWTELSLYPGSSSRATREQREHFQHAFDEWSGAVARYMAAVHRLYTFIDSDPQRARALFAAILHEHDDGELPLFDEERPYVDEVIRAIDDIAARMDAEEATATTLADEADLIFNPFPARIVVRVPGGVLESEGFSSDLTIEPTDLLDAVTALDGRWISPDPLALLLRESSPSSEELAALPRRSTPQVRASDVAAALKEKLARPARYRLRWRS